MIVKTCHYVHSFPKICLQGLARTALPWGSGTQGYKLIKSLFTTGWEVSGASDLRQEEHQAKSPGFS